MVALVKSLQEDHAIIDAETPTRRLFEVMYACEPCIEIVSRAQKLLFPMWGFLWMAQ